MRNYINKSNNFKNKKIVMLSHKIPLNNNNYK